MQTLKPFVDFIIACFTFNKRKNESAWLDTACVIVLSEQFIALVLKLVMYDQVTFEIVTHKIDF